MRFVSSFFLAVIFVSAQTAKPQSLTSTAFLSQLSSQIPPGTSPQSLHMAGSAEWWSGSLHETGTATYDAKADGSMTMALGLNQAAKTETRTALAVGRVCQWTDQNSTVHAIADGDCLLSIPWFAPLLFLSSASLPQLLSVSDDGVVTSEGSTLHQISYATLLPGPISATKRMVSDATRVRVLYDPQTLLPSSVEYNIHADDDLTRTIPVRVVYSNFRTNGAFQVAYRMDRYVNNSLQLSLTFSSVSIN